MGKVFYVVGGEYVDTTFREIAPGHTEQRMGPFTQQEALNIWRGLTGKTVDNALVRYFVRQEEDAVPDQWLVVGGEYSDTTFKTLAVGAKLEVHGPYVRAHAMDKWRELTGKTIDSAVTRFEIIEEAELEVFKAGR